MSSITRQQFQELRTLEESDYGEFIRRLELYTGIEAVPCTAYQFYMEERRNAITHGDTVVKCCNRDRCASIYEYMEGQKKC